MCCEKWSRVAEMRLFPEGPGEPPSVLCLCSRAFVGDRKLCGSGPRGRFAPGGGAAGDQPTEEEDGGPSQDAGKSGASKDTGPEESELDSEAELMRSMGLPLQFGGTSSHKNFEVAMNTRNKVKIKKKKKKHQKKYLEEIMRESWRQEYEDDDILASEDEQYANPSTRKRQAKKDVKTESLPVANTVSPELEITEGWEKYWSEYGGQLLWQSWQEKHAEQTLCPEPWNLPDTKEEWEEHYSQLYWFYLEQFQYWAAQGWTFDASQGCHTDALESRTEAESERDENCVTTDSVSSPSVTLDGKGASLDDSENNEMLERISNIDLNAEEAGQSQLNCSGGCDGQQPQDSKRECPVSGQSGPCSGGATESSLSESQGANQPSRGSQETSAARERPLPTGVDRDESDDDPPEDKPSRLKRRQVSCACSRFLWSVGRPSGFPDAPIR